MSLVEESWLRANVNESDSLAAVKVAFTALAEGTVTQPPVMQLQFAQTGGETCIKSAFLGGRPIAAVKIASGFYNNPQREPPLPSGSGVIIVLDASTGLPLALLSDGGFLTDMRTGAAGALAVELLAPRRKLKKIAIIGAGAQARCTFMQRN
jgi:ornithine cyclodeaminase